MNILVIDDDKDICESLKKVFALDGYKVKSISKPENALKELEKKTYHLIILDLKMPGISGEDLLKKIRKIDNDIMVFILTAYPSVDSAVQALQSQVSDYIKKPFKNSELRDKVRSALMSKSLILEPDEDLNIKIGTKVRELRGKNRLTLKQLAERTNLSVSLISQIERAESAASISTLNKIVTALNIRLTVLFQDI
ncbi:MAG: response regulator [Candidatus Brocadiales bacterium]|nr:response regulator [Candidatus Brocadiales bacterium]